MAAQSDPEGTETRILRHYAELASGTQRVLEVGCGDGRLTWRYARDVEQVAGIDLSAEDLRLATIDRPTDLAQRVGFVRADAVRLPFRSEAFDLAIFAWSF